MTAHMSFDHYSVTVVPTCHVNDDGKAYVHIETHNRQGYRVGSICMDLQAASIVLEKLRDAVDDALQATAGVVVVGEAAE